MDGDDLRATFAGWAVKLANDNISGMTRSRRSRSRSRK